MQTRINLNPVVVVVVVVVWMGPPWLMRQQQQLLLVVVVGVVVKETHIATRTGWCLLKFQSSQLSRYNHFILILNDSILLMNPSIPNVHLGTIYIWYYRGD